MELQEIVGFLLLFLATLSLFTTIIRLRDKEENTRLNRMIKRLKGFFNKY